jgi:hypothetical protein
VHEYRHALTKGKIGHTRVLLRRRNVKKYRQGDVIITEVESIPEGAIPIEGETLALGEVTGHSHRFPPGSVQLFKWNEKTYGKIVNREALRHEEHKPITIKGDFFEYKIQRQYTPGGWDYVAD